MEHCFAVSRSHSLEGEMIISVTAIILINNYNYQLLK